MRECVCSRSVARQLSCWQSNFELVLTGGTRWHYVLNLVCDRLQCTRLRLQATTESDDSELQVSRGSVACGRATWHVRRERTESCS